MLVSRCNFAQIFVMIIESRGRQFCSRVRRYTFLLSRRKPSIWRHLDRFRRELVSEILCG
jgi:hypothetical protein